MSVAFNIFSLLKSFSLHQHNAFVYYAEFADYIRRYAQKHIAENPDLTPYLSQSQDVLLREINKLSDQHKIVITNPDTDKRGIIVIAYLVEKYNNRFLEIQNNPAIAYPLVTDLPKHTPAEVIERKQATEFIVQLFEKHVEQNPNVLYGLVLPRDLPLILLPGITNIQILLDIALGKIRQMLRKEEYHDYFLKKLKISNPGKEISAKNFFAQFITKPNDALDSLKGSGDSFYFWSQLCFFIRQDYEKVKDYTQEDIAVLQSVCITEISISFFKNKAQQDLQRATALKNLEQILNKPPYYFNRDAILKFVDSRSIPLLGQYSEDDLNNYLHEQTTSLSANELPLLLTFKPGGDQRYYIYKNKVIPLIVRLCSDARDTVRGNITKEWFAYYKIFEHVPEMSDQKAFEERLEKEVKVTSPVLYALLNSNFLSLVHYESRVSHDPASDKINLFSNGKLLSYSELLMMNRNEIITDTKILLPFWYTVPVISWIAALILKPSKKEIRKQKTIVHKKPIIEQDDDDEENEPIQKKASQGDRKKELKNAAIALEEILVPTGSTLDRELAAYIHQWNKMINKKIAAELTEDVNSLIRDYTRKTIKTLHGSTFTSERVAHLAETLARTPALQKIKDHEQLVMYIQLYIVRLVKNL